MNIIITEAQYNELNKEKLREFLFAFWDNQKKHGEEPSLDDMLYNVLDVRKNTREDLETIRPLWYRYNGGYDVLFDKVKNEIDTKEFNLVDSYFDLDTTMKVVNVDKVGEIIEIMVDIDPRGTIEYSGWDEEEEQEYTINDTIYVAYQEAQSNYETGDLMGMLRSSVYDFFYNLLDEYGVPINVDIDLEEIYGVTHDLNESFSDEMDGIKVITKYWKSKLNKGEDMTFNKDELEYFNITEFSPKLRAQEIFYDLLGGHKYTTNFIDGLLNKTFSTEDFNEKLTGGYNFEWVITDYIYEDWKYKLRGEVLPGGTVEMMNGKILTLDDALNNEDFGWEIHNEIVDVIRDCMEIVITPKTGAFVRVSSILLTEE